MKGYRTKRISLPGGRSIEIVLFSSDDEEPRLAHEAADDLVPALRVALSAATSEARQALRRRGDRSGLRGPLAEDGPQRAPDDDHAHGRSTAEDDRGGRCGQAELP